MKWNKKFTYPKSSSIDSHGQRHYEIGNEKLPSVTTILSDTVGREA